MSYLHRFDAFETSNRAVRCGVSNMRINSIGAARISHRNVSTNEDKYIDSTKDQCVRLFPRLGPSVRAVRNTGPLRIPFVICEEYDYDSLRRSNTSPVVCTTMVQYLFSRSTHHQENTRHSRAAQPIGTALCSDSSIVQ